MIFVSSRTSSTLLVLIPLFIILFSIQSYAQAPQYIKYQAVARDNNGNPLAGEVVGLRLSIRHGSSEGPIVYREVHDVMTNAFGLVTVNLGAGTSDLGVFSMVDWSDGHNTGFFPYSVIKDLAKKVDGGCGSETCGCKG